MYIMSRAVVRRRKYKKRYRKTAYNIAKRALKISRRIQRGQESKFIDNLIIINNCDNLGSGPFPLNTPLQGLGQNDRVGDKIMCSQMRVRYLCTRDNSSAAAIRMIFIWDKKDTIQNVGDLLDAGGLGAETAIITDYNQNKRGDYVVLYDKMICIDGTYKIKNLGKITKKLNKLTEFAPASVNIEQGALKFFAISDVSGIAANVPNCDISCRLFYKDS